MRRCQRGRDRQITRERPAQIKPKVSARYRFVERFQVSAGHAEGVIKSRLPKTAEARIHLERGSRPVGHATPTLLRLYFGGGYVGRISRPFATVSALFGLGDDV